MGQLEARTSFLAPPRRHFRRGDLIDSADPVVRGRERLFFPVEQATAAPGELRTLAYQCDVCGKVAASRAGLGAHRRVHRDD